MVEVTIRRTDHLKGTVCAPPSKAYTQRMLVAAALSNGSSRISNPLVSDDTEAALRAVKAFGAEVKATGDCWTVEGAMPIKSAMEPIDCGESGATLRFMIPVSALAPKPSVFVLGNSLAKRPIEPLLETLRQLGAKAHVKKMGGKSAIQVEGGGIQGGKASIAGDISSQFISGLMFACPLARSDTELNITTPLESKSYVKMTQSVLEQHGIKVSISEDHRHLHIPSNQKYIAADDKVPGDFSSAAFLLAAAAITNSQVTVKNLDYTTKQGDKVILGILKKMGVNGTVCADSVEIIGEAGLLNGVDVDARDIPDLVPICTILACCAQGSSRIYNAQRLRLKESDRLNSLYVELRKLGANITMNESSLTVKGLCKLHGGIVDPHNDHRIAMACAVAALQSEGETVIQDSECVRKSYPQFFTDLQVLGVDMVGGKLDR